MRTALWFSIAVMGGIAMPLSAQSDDAVPAFNGLRTPVSPAFVLLGIAPTVVERPNTPSDLALSVLNRSAAFTSLPRDIALELSPYWLVKHPTLRWQDDIGRGVGTSVARTMTISFATAELGTTDRPVTGLSLAFRAAPFSGRLSDTTVAQLAKIDSTLTGHSALLDSLTASGVAEIDAIRLREVRAAAAQGDSAAMKTALARHQARLDSLTREGMEDPRYLARMDSSREQFKQLAFIREGFVLEVAAGAAMQAPGGAADSAKLARFGAWITAGYEGPTLSFVFVNRFLASSVDSTFDAVDLGMRLIYTSGRYAISAEGSFRTFTEAGAPSNEYRVAALVDFQLQKGFWVTGTFGRDYSAGTPGSLIAQVGFSMNMAGERVKIPNPLGNR